MRTCSQTRMPCAALGFARASRSCCVFGPSASASMTTAIIVSTCFGLAPMRFSSDCTSAPCDRRLHGGDVHLEIARRQQVQRPPHARRLHELAALPTAPPSRPRRRRRPPARPERELGRRHHLRLNAADVAAHRRQRRPDVVHQVMPRQAKRGDLIGCDGCIQSCTACHAAVSATARLPALPAY